ncbi:MAG TPA: family 1 encapsulin nanocompartment shell protein [Dehalococcoidia bacterium]|nr:family 1 encapsulin nanocompartment shell protein [Dehalococcoidia bacterium]
MAAYDFLSRAESPCSPAQWAQIDDAVTDVARRALVGRRFIPVFGPVGPGLQTISDDVFLGTSTGVVDPFGEEECDRVRARHRKIINLPIVHKDFMIHWRDIETSHQFNLPLETSTAVSAASFCARAEDDLIFNGNEDLEMEGLLTAEGRNTLPLGDWGMMGGAFRDVVNATQCLTEAGFYGPYAMVVSPRLYTNLNRVYENTGILELEQVQKLISDGVFRSPVIPEGTAIVVATGAQNMDLVLGQDMATAYLGSDKMNHELRVFEILALRIKRPQAIVTLKPTTRPGG